MRKARLTTIDNPFDPFDQFDEWFAFDQQKNNLVHQYFNGDTCQVRAKYSPNTDDLPDAYANELDELAIDRICDDFKTLKIFKKVVKEF